ncbi:hypothetical protein NDI76_19360 [Halogeometricum sp. S1BR25-6]|uniref:Uncharacterized protein n=1 Tax=Halogeometricum salsisoli TaxID=2950536 RepID=A0ABU2GL15_9EURY|nr:hypothetical protein [Halogeometricum sp. S1BR25-6]MDS0300909.1 hypothetical protein [Halogeometricum sp. S1BR25-6]
MTEGEFGLFASTPEAVFYLVSDNEAVDDLLREKSAVLDEQPGVQTTLSLEQLAEPTLFDSLLKQGKVGSRWGKDLSDTYRDYLQDRIEQVNESVLENEFESQFRRYNADPYESAVLGDPMTIGIDLTEQIQKAIDQWDEHQFTRDDLAAAVGIAARNQEISDRDTYGGIIFTATEPLSDIKQSQSFLRASRNLQQLLLMGLDVALVAPVGGPDEETIVENVFRSVGSFSIESVAGGQFDVDEEIVAAVDEWYDRLRYDVADNRVVEKVVRPASVTAYDLPDELWARHFKNSVIGGLQRAYSKKSFNQKRFDELWEQRISSHPNYDKYRSRRSSFPEVKVTRKDDESNHEFRLHHEGPSAKPYVCNLPARTSTPEEELIDWIERFLDAEPVSEQRWQELTKVFSKLSGSLGTTSDSLVENALLHRHRRRQNLSPLIPPSEIRSETGKQKITGAKYEEEWYDEHWSAILSDYKITKQGGVGAIERKQDLQHSLDPEDPADEALYYKLERDIENAWEHYCNGVIEELRQSVTNDQNLSIKRQETRSGQEITITIEPDSRQTRTVVIETLLPYSEVYVNDSRVRAATITNTVSAVIDHLGTNTQVQQTEVSRENKVDLLFATTEAYLDVAEFGQGDLVYFDDIIEFSLALPNIERVFNTPEQDVEAEIRELLGTEQYMSRLREWDVSFHRKGSDQHGSVKVQGDRYIAMELQEPL